MFTKTVLLEKAKTITVCTILFLGCITLLACESSAADWQEDNEVRTELVRVLELQLGVAASLGRSDLTATLEKAIANVQFASEAELEPAAGAIGEIKNYGDSLQRLDSSIQNALAAGEDQSLETSSFVATTSVPPVSLSPPEYYDGSILGIHCLLPDASSGVRNNTEVVLLAKSTLGAAKVFWAGMEVVCGLDLTAIVSVGVASVVCIAAAASVGLAEEVVDGLLMCDATVDEAHLDAAFNRAEDNFILGTHIHDDLDTHDTDIKELLFEIAANQREIIKLLKTPQGNRPGWNTEGY